MFSVSGAGNLIFHRWHVHFVIEVVPVCCTLDSSMMNSIQNNEASGSKFRVLRQRSLSTCVLLALLAGALLWNHEIGYYGLVCLFCILTSWEWRHMLLHSGKAGRPNLLFVFGSLYPLALSLVCYGAKIDAQGSMLHAIGLPLLVLIAAPALLVIWAFILELKRPLVGSRSMRSVATTLLGFIYPVWLFALAIPAIHLAYMQQGFVAPGTVMLVLWVILVTKMSDIFAYVSGFLAGGRFFARKMIPHISPKKTWEGIIGSWVLTNAVGIGLLGPMFGVKSLSFLYVAEIAVVITFLFILAVCGDLAGSLIKRSLDVKDSGSLLPGIGGVFDLIDSPAFTVPVAFLACLFVYLS